MSRRTMNILVILCSLSALNVITLVLNLSQPTRAAVGGMSYQDLLRDPDFTRAVKSITEQCKIDAVVSTLKC
jgi:hypothetical protein